MLAIRFARGAIDDLARLTAPARTRILAVIETRLRTHGATTARNRKQLIGLVPPWEDVQPVWELRVDDYRAFYDVDTRKQEVVVRPVRKKGRHTTEEIL